jgi:uncharacterized protein
MRIDLDSNPNCAHLVRSYHPKRVQIDGDQFDCSLIVTATQLITRWPVTQIEELNETTWQPILQLKPDLVIVGTGDQQQFLPPEQVLLIHHARLGLEVMNNKSACYTYNALIAEGRNVVLALIMSKNE